jgi:hypothetical protein
MRDFVVYHNPDSMGVDITEVDAFSIVTDKTVSEAIGDRVWLLSGRGKPRKFLLRSYFLVDEIDRDTVAAFQTRLSGKIGKKFDPMIELNNEGWFEDFKESQGNFAFGLQRIKDQRFIEGLKSLAQSEI